MASTATLAPELEAIAPPITGVAWRIMWRGTQWHVRVAPWHRWDIGRAETVAVTNTRYAALHMVRRLGFVPRSCPIDHVPEAGHVRLADLVDGSEWSMLAVHNRDPSADARGHAPSNVRITA